jgi:DNA-binding transcriptional ArsR family regulator
MSLRFDIDRVLILHDTRRDPEAAVDELLAIFASYAKALSHPLRGQILTLLEAGRRSPNQIAAELGNGASLGTVSYHVRYLHGLDLIRLVGTEPRRGAVEHFYEAR